MAGTIDMTMLRRERATPVAHKQRGNRKEQAPLEWRAPSEETEK